MVYKKTIRINGKVFEKRDLVRIGEILQGEAGDTGSLIYTIVFSDEVALEQDNISIFDDYMIEVKKAQNVSMTYIGKDRDRRIDFELEACAVKGSYNKIVIQSDDKAWFFSIVGKLDDFLKSVKNQSKMHQVLFSADRTGTISLIMGAILSVLSYSLLNPIDDTWEKIVFVPIVLLCFICSFVVFFSWASAYPDIEFNFGPQDQNKALNMRKRLAWISSTIVIPIIISLIF